MSKISEMQPADPLDGSEYIEVVQAGTNKRLQTDSLFAVFGRSAYDLAVENGFSGTLVEWIASLQGKSMYDLAVDDGFTGTIEEYLESLKGSDGLSAFELAVQGGYVGTELEWTNHLTNALSIPIGGAGEVLSNDGEKLEWVMMDKHRVGLSNIDNTSDLSKPVSIATQIELNEKLNITDLESYVGNLSFDYGTY